MFESHIYAYGKHGFSTGEAHLNSGKMCSRVPNWVPDSIAWLGDVFGILTPDGFGEPACPGKVSGDWEEHLSVDCTIGHLRRQSEEVQQLLSGIFQVIHEALSERGMHDLDGSPLLSRIKLLDLLVLIGLTAKEIGQLDASLRQHPNVRR